MAAVPLGPFVRFLITAAAAAYSNWDTISNFFDRADEEPAIDQYGRYVQNIFEMKDATGAWTTRERGLFGIHYINVTGGDLDQTWVAADFTAVESAIQTFLSGKVSYMSPEIRFVEHRWYAFGPGVVAPNPPVRVTTLGTPIVGTGSTWQAHQVASTVTFRTPLRRHWGRVYLPLLGQPLGTGSQFTTASVDAVATDLRTALTAPNTSQGVVPVIYDRNRKSVIGITGMESDSVPDIVRRRRPRTTAYRKIFTS